jgi:septum formation protein
MKTKPRIILASESARRKLLMRRFGLEFQTIASNATECSPSHLTPVEIAKTNAQLKASSVSKEHPNALVIGADTVVALKSKTYGKPKDLQEAFSFLKQLSGKTHEVSTGVCLISQKPYKVRSFAVTTQVGIQPLQNQAIREYLSMINPLDKAGAYAIQEHGEWIIGEIYGSYTNVVGLPMERLTAELNHW